MTPEVDRDTIRRLADAPLADPLKLNLPLGRRAPRREPKQQPAPGALTTAEVRQRKVNAKDAKMKALLDYYAGTTVPFDRIALHLKMETDHVRQAMLQRGRRA